LHNTVVETLNEQSQALNCGQAAFDAAGRVLYSAQGVELTTLEKQRAISHELSEKISVASTID
jgi:hypothetical protein